MSSVTHYEPHPIADALPEMSQAGYAAFKEHMRAVGYDRRYPIVLWEGKILDGRHRYKAAMELGIEPCFFEAPPDGCPWDIAITGESRRNYESDVQRVACLAPLVKEAAAWHAAQREVQEQANAARRAAAEEGRVGRAAAKRTEEFSETTKGGSTKPAEPKPPVANRQKAEGLAKQIGTGRKAVETWEWLERNAAPAVVDAVKAGTVKPADAIRETKRVQLVDKLEQTAAREVIAPTGVFDVVVIDPPWPMEKIERDLFPTQVGLDYPTMSEQELAALELPCDADCHVWLWTTQRFLPMALRLLNAWQLKYVCTFVWHKPGGFQPIGLPQYNCEFALYARRGSPKFIDTTGLPTCFSAGRGAHSEKPEEFYDMVRRVTGGRRLDMFNRRAIDGFTGWGQEAAA